MRFRFKDTGGLLKSTSKEWMAKDPFRQSAVIAYYSIFSLPALLVLIITFTGFFFGKREVGDLIFGQIGQTMGTETALQVESMLDAASKSKDSIWATILGVIVLVSGATGVFVELQKTLNLIWEVRPSASKSSLWQTIRARLFSFGLILAIAFLLLISLVVSTALAAFSDWLSVDGSKIVAALFVALDFIVSLFVISALFAGMFKFFPDARIKWKDVWVGALVTGLLFILGKTAIAFYFGKADPGSGYGAAGSIILILLWVSYSSMIVFFGAEFTHEWALKYSGEVKPANFAEKDPSSDHPKAA